MNCDCVGGNVCTICITLINTRLVQDSVFHSFNKSLSSMFSTCPYARTYTAIVTLKVPFDPDETGIIPRRCCNLIT